MPRVHITTSDQPVSGHGPQRVFVYLIARFRDEYHPIAIMSPLPPPSSSLHGPWQPAHTAAVVGVVRRFLDRLARDLNAQFCISIERCRSADDEEGAAGEDQFIAAAALWGTPEETRTWDMIFASPVFGTPYFRETTRWFCRGIDDEVAGTDDGDVSARTPSPESPVHWRALPRKLTLPFNDNDWAAVVIDVTDMDQVSCGVVRPLPEQSASAGGDGAGEGRTCVVAPLDTLLDLWLEHPAHDAMVQMAGSIPWRSLPCLGVFQGKSSFLLFFGKGSRGW